LLREFAERLRRTAGLRAIPAVAGMDVSEWLRGSGSRSAALRVGAAVVVALLAAGALFAATSLPSWSLLALPQGRILPPTDDRSFGWIERAIGQCEREAARTPYTLYFLVIPVVPTDGDAKAWIPKSNGTIGTSVLLLGSQDTLEGLRAGSLRLDRRAYRFSILDPATSHAYDWRLALGVHKFAIRDASTIAAFKPGFDFRSRGGVTWADGAIPREAGTCYWTGTLARS
jgi:hypothetical protein